MDNSSLLIDNSQFKCKIREVIDSSVTVMEKGTINIFREINKMREEYTGLINKCNFYMPILIYKILQLWISVKKKTSILIFLMRIQIQECIL